MTPGGLSSAYCKERGWRSGRVDSWIPGARITRDLFGFADLLVFMDGGAGILLVQATSAPNVSARVKKLLESDLAREWVAEGNRAEVWGWSKVPRKGRGALTAPDLTTKDGRYRLRRVRFTSK